MYDWWVQSLTAHPPSVRQTQLRRGPQSYPPEEQIHAPHADDREDGVAYLTLVVHANDDELPGLSFARHTGGAHLEALCDRGQILFAHDLVHVPASLYALSRRWQHCIKKPRGQQMQLRP